MRSNTLINDRQEQHPPLRPKSRGVKNAHTSATTAHYNAPGTRPTRGARLPYATQRAHDVASVARLSCARLPPRAPAAKTRLAVRVLFRTGRPSPPRAHAAQPASPQRLQLLLASPARGINVQEPSRKRRTAYGESLADNVLSQATDRMALGSFSRQFSSCARAALHLLRPTSRLSEPFDGR